MTFYALIKWMRTHGIRLTPKAVPSYGLCKQHILQPLSLEFAV